MATARPTPYESRLRGWARNAGMGNALTAEVDELVEYLRDKKRLAAFYRAFPMYDPDSHEYDLRAA